MVFTRSRDVSEYIYTLEDIINVMLNDLVSLYNKKNNCTLDANDVLDWYCDIVSDPDPLEMCLIKDGTFSEEHIKELHNICHQNFIKHLEYTDQELEDIMVHELHDELDKMKNNKNK